MEDFTVACSPLTSTIFAGKPKKNGLWGNKKYDVTKASVNAVAQHLIQKKSKVTFDYDGKRYVMEVKEVAN